MICRRIASGERGSSLIIRSLRDLWLSGPASAWNPSARKWEAFRGPSVNRSHLYRFSPTFSPFILFGREIQQFIITHLSYTCCISHRICIGEDGVRGERSVDSWNRIRNGSDVTTRRSRAIISMSVYRVSFSNPVCVELKNTTANSRAISSQTGPRRGPPRGSRHIIAIVLLSLLILYLC